MIAILAIGADTVAARLRRLGPETHRRLAAAIADAAEELRQAAADSLGGGPLARSIGVAIEDGDGTVSATIGSDLALAKLVAGGTRPHVIEAKSTRALRFLAGGKEIFVRRVSHPGAQERPFLAAALADRQAAILARLRAAVGEAA